MAALQLTPKSYQYLRTDIVANQLDQNSTALELTASATSNVTPRLRLDGSGRAYLSGSLKLAGTTTPATKLFHLPKTLRLMDGEPIIPVMKVSGGTYSNTGLFIQENSSGIDAVTFTDTGAFTAQPSFALTGPGTGAVIAANIRVNAAVAASDPTAGTSYLVADTITLAGGTRSISAQLRVTSIAVYALTINNAGTGGTPGTQTVTGTDGYGTPFTASVTVDGSGIITAINTILTEGIYTSNPPLVNHAVTGAGLVGASFNLKTEPLTFSVDIPGSYTVIPTNPVAQTSSSGSGTGITLTCSWHYLNATVIDGGTGYTSASGITFTGAGSAAATLVVNAADNQIYGQITGDGIVNDIISLDGVTFFVDYA